MTVDKDRKRIIRARMQKTGESYTTARTQILSRIKNTSSPTPAISIGARGGREAAVDRSRGAGRHERRQDLREDRTHVAAVDA